MQAAAPSCSISRMSPYRRPSCRIHLILLALCLSQGGSFVRVQARGSRKIQLDKPHPEAKPKEDHITFDPMVAEVERHRDDEAWEEQYERDHHEKHHLKTGHHYHHDEDHDYVDATEEDSLTEEDAEHEEFLHEAGVDDPDSLDEDELSHVNMEKRIERLFPLIDIAPADGKIDFNELSAWELMQYQQMQDHRMGRELEAMDVDDDGFVSLKEYLHDDSPGDAVKDWKDQPDSDRDYYRQEMERFAVADNDGDGKLDKTQLYKVLHPEESDDPRMHEQMRKEELKNYDMNKNGRIEIGEWLEGFWHMIFDWEDEEYKWQSRLAGKPYKVSFTGQEKKDKGKKRFKDLDTDGDGALSADELEPVMHIMMPGERHFADQTARHLVEQADEDGDLKLTKEEMKKHKHVFYELERTHEVDHEHEHEVSSDD